MMILACIFSFQNNVNVFVWLCVTFDHNNIDDYYVEKLTKFLATYQLVLFTCSQSFQVSGLQITAGQWTMSGQNWVLTGQILRLPEKLSGHLPTRSEKF